MTRNFTIVGTFDNESKAEGALERLLGHGFEEAEVTVLVADRSEGRHFTVDAKRQFPAGAAWGGVIGGSVGALIAGITAAFGFTLPGLDLALGSVVTAFVGAGVGGVIGWLVGGVIGLGFDEHEAKLIEGEGGNGHILLGVRTHSDLKAKFAEQAFEDGGATSVAA